MCCFVPAIRLWMQQASLIPSAERLPANEPCMKAVLCCLYADCINMGRHQGMRDPSFLFLHVYLQTMVHLKIDQEQMNKHKNIWEFCLSDVEIRW